MMTAAAAVATAAGADADTANRVESAWTKLKGSLQDSLVEVRNLVMERILERSYTRETCKFQILQRLQEGSKMAEANKSLHQHQGHGNAHRLAGKVWGRERGIRHSIPR